MSRWKWGRWLAQKWAVPPDWMLTSCVIASGLCLHIQNRIIHYLQRSPWLHYKKGKAVVILASYDYYKCFLQQWLVFDYNRMAGLQDWSNGFSTFGGFKWHRRWVRNIDRCSMSWDVILIPLYRISVTHIKWYGKVYTTIFGTLR